MTTKELIRAEVKRLFEKYQESERQASKYCDSCANEDIAFYQGKRKVCSEILSYLDTLPDEPVEKTCKTCGFYENDCPFIRGKFMPYPNIVCKDYTSSIIRKEDEQ